MKKKVFGIGLNKTGTKTLGACFIQLGYSHKSIDKQVFELYKKGDLNGLLNIIDNYDSFEDWPWPLVYKDIDEKSPDSKFILTIRETPETWFNSLCRHADYTGPTEYRKHIYGFAMPHKHKQHHLDFYNDHLKDITDYFKNKPGKLLVVCWENGDGWEKLSTFLGFERPNIPLPHKNRRRSNFDVIKNRFFLRKIEKCVQSYIHTYFQLYHKSNIVY